MNRGYVYTRPELYYADHQGATWLVRITIVLVMVGMVAALRRPLLDTFAATFPSWRN